MGDRFAVLGGASVAEHTEGIQRQIRASPRDAGLRLALCHFLALRGEWQRAKTQLEVAIELDPTFLAASAACSMALAGEKHRAEFWAGGRPPTVICNTANWIEQLISAAAVPAEFAAKAASLRESARQTVPALQGTLSYVSHPVAESAQAQREEFLEHSDFAWICDGDVRIGAVLEIFTPSGYAWLPMTEVRRVSFAQPQHLVDLIWRPAAVEVHAGRGLNGLVPVRYAGGLDELDDATLLGRRTEWRSLPGEEQYAGVGARTLISDAGDHSLLDIRRIEFASARDSTQ